MLKRAFLVAASLSLAACAPPLTPAPPPPAAAAPAPAAESVAVAAQAAPRLDGVPRAELNRIAAALDLPLFWIADRNGSGGIDPEEVALLWGSAGAPAWTEAGAFTPAFYQAYAAIVRVKAVGHPRAGMTEAERRRRDAVLVELSQGRPSLVRSDFRAAPAEDRAIVQHLLRAADRIERIHARQLGSFGLEQRVLGDDPASRALFHRNQGPWCEQPKTESDADCSAIPGGVPKISGLYPASVQKDPKFCETLEARKDARALMSPFTVVTETGGELGAVPYSEAYRDDMEAVSRELKAAAEAIRGTDEAAFKGYLLAAAQAFLDNKWEPADEAWAKMSVNNSKWYLRIGPDETYFEPCSHKAGFHMSFATVNQESRTWQKRLEPVKGDMEAAYAKLAGRSYRAHKVTFHLPDFIDIILNAGDSRASTGGTAGQSLPNWGPVANEGRGRTVAMVNIFQDEDSLEALRAGVQALFCKPTADRIKIDPSLSNMTTVLHEAAHNLGPSHEYKVRGKTDEEIFGGPLAATFEELKAQMGSLYFAGWLMDKGIVDAKTAEQSIARDIVWAFGQIKGGVYTGDGKPKPYGQLSAIQIGTFLEAGAMRWSAEEAAANGRDMGCFTIDTAKMRPAIDKLAAEVLRIKARGDKAGAVRLRERYVDKDGPWKSLRAVIQERMRRSPAASLVYEILL